MPGTVLPLKSTRGVDRNSRRLLLDWVKTNWRMVSSWLNSRVVKCKLFTRVTLLLWSPAVLLRIQILFKPNTEANLSTTIGYASSKWRICNNFLALPLFPPLLSVSSAPPPSVCPPFPSSFPISVKMCIVGSFTSSFPCTVMPCIECYCNLFVTF